MLARSTTSSTSPPRRARRIIYAWGRETLDVGSAGTKNTLELARKYRAGFLHASTSECYGDPDVHPQPESYWGHVNPIGPRSVYDEAKRFSEAIVTAYHRYYDVDIHMVRIFNTYGPRLQPSDGRVISNLMMQAIQGEDLTIYGDGSQTRSFCYVSDLIAGILLLSRSEEHSPVNIGNPEEWTIAECAQAVLEVTGSRSEIRHEPLPQDDPTRRRPDITKARELLGWSPRSRCGRVLRSRSITFDRRETARKRFRLIYNRDGALITAPGEKLLNDSSPVLVTGGAGFIGSNFILDWLERDGSPILNLDKLTYAGNLQNLVSVEGKPAYSFEQGDICDRALVDALLRRHHPRAIVHFAAESHVDRSLVGPEAFIQTNIFGTFCLLEAARAYLAELPAKERAGFRFLHVSTDEVYGTLGPGDAAFEETTAYAPNSPYAASKAASDHLVRSYVHSYGFPAITSNCSNNYGPYQFPEKSLPLMIQTPPPASGCRSMEMDGRFGTGST